MNTQRYSKIKTLKDIKLEKARIRYEMLVAENGLMDNIASIQRLVTITSTFSRITQGFHLAHSIYEGIHNLTGKLMFWRKKKKKSKESKDD